TEENSYNISVTIVDDGVGTLSGTTATATVSEGVINFTPGTNFGTVEGNNSGTQTVANFSDTGLEPASAYTATIHWGDGNDTAGAVTQNSPGNFTVTGVHTYAEEGFYNISVTITDDGVDTVSGTTASATVSDPAVLASGVALTPVEGASFTSVVANFTDPAGYEGDSHYSATINWGDGSAPTAGTISAGAVSGTHTYAEESAGDHAGSTPYQITVTISHEGAASAVANSTATVSDPAVLASGVALTPVEGASFTSVVATFTDPGGYESASDYSATTDWG